MPQFNSGAAEQIGRFSEGLLLRLLQLGEIRDRTYENQQHRASGLNLVVTAIVLWNTR
jgi:TnpA family transposase